MRLSTALKLLAVLAAVLAVGLVAATKSMDFQRIKGLVVEQVQAATGRTLTIAGPLELRLGLIPKIIATGVSLGNVPGGSRPEMIKVERIEAEVALLPLLKRELRIQRLVLTAPDVLLEAGRGGQVNWSFSPAKAAPADAADAARGDRAGVAATRFTLREVKIKNARLSWREGDTLNTFYLHKLTVLPEATARQHLAVKMVGNLGLRMLDVDGRVVMPSAADKPWSVQLKATFDGLLAKVEGTVADPLAGRGLALNLAVQGDELGKVLRLGEGAAAEVPPPALGPFKLSANLGDGHGALALSEMELSAGRRDALLVTARGAVRDLSRVEGVDLSLMVESDTLAGLSRLTGTEVPSMGPLKATGLLSGGAGQWKLADLKATLAGSDVNGELALDARAARPVLTGALTSGVLNLADFTTPASKPGEKLAPKSIKAADDGRLFPAEPLSLETLRALDARLTLKAQRLGLGALHLADLSAAVELAGGRLSLRPVRALAAGAPVEAEAVLDGSAKVPALSLRLNGRGLDLGRLLQDAGNEALTGGRTDLRVDLRAAGPSWRALMASASGEAVVSVGEGRLRNTALNWAGGDLLVQLVGILNPLSRSEDSTPLSCAVARFVVRDGIATADRGIAVETAKVNVVGAGTVNLRDEQLDLGITPRARDGIGLSLTSPLAGMTRIRGTLAEPALSLDELGTVRTAATVGAAVATGGLSLVGEALFDRLTGDSNPCRTALGAAAPAAKAGDKKAGKGKKAEPGLLDGLFGR